MKSLQERQEERAVRKFNNETESTAGDISGGLGRAQLAMENAKAAYLALTESEREELQLAMAGEKGFAELSPAEDADGNFKYAGIGIVNPFVVNPADAPPPPDLDAARAAVTGVADRGTNLNGQALEQAGNGAGEAAGGPVANTGWGAPPAGGGSQDDDGDELPEVKTTMPVADLVAIGEKEGADLSTATNNDLRVAAILANREAKAAS